LRCVPPCTAMHMHTGALTAAAMSHALRLHRVLLVCMWGLLQVRLWCCHHQLSTHKSTLVSWQCTRLVAAGTAGRSAASHSLQLCPAVADCLLPSCPCLRLAGSAASRSTPTCRRLLMSSAPSWASWARWRRPTASCSSATLSWRWLSRSRTASCRHRRKPSHARHSSCRRR
jgi:hypothetical protein